METLVNLVLDIGGVKHHGLSAAATGSIIIGELSNRNLKGKFDVGSKSPRVHVHLVDYVLFADEASDVKFDRGKDQILGPRALLF